MVLNGKTSQHADTLILDMFTSPVINTEKVMDLFDFSWTAANNLIKKLIDLNILREKNGYKRNRTYELYEYLELFR